MVEFGRFGILADGRPIRLGGRAFDVLMALTRFGPRLARQESSTRTGSRAQDYRAAQRALAPTAS
jgi:hypothetical protein